jgi:hypothetical protein
MMAKQSTTFEVRFRRIWRMILSCGFGFADLSYMTRMNIPLELGLMLALGKNCFIASRRRYEALGRVSDLNLGDIHYHEGRPRSLIADFSRWIEQHCSHQRISVARLVSRFRTLVALRRYFGQEDFDRFTPQQLAAMLRSAERNLRIVVGPLR